MSGGEVRLQKFLARAGLASRRGAESLILEGRVRVNGEVVGELGSKLDPARDSVTVDGRPIAAAPTTWIALHKPPGFVCTRHDPQARPTVYDLLPPEHRKLFTVGRLDFASEGLLLLTNDGDTAHRLLHPRFGIEREYLADVIGEPDAAALDRLTAGIRLEDGPARAKVAETRVSGRGARARNRVRLILAEGRKREVRRMMDALGHPVRRLVRQRYGPVRLGRLAAGQWRPLQRWEIEAIERGPEGTPLERRRKSGRTGT